MKKRPSNWIALLSGTIGILLTSCAMAPYEIPGASSAAELSLFAELDRARSERGLSLWTRSDDLSSLARGHSAQMASGETGFGHAGFGARAKAMRNRLPISASAENVARSTQSESNLAAYTLRSWVDSDAHRENLFAENRYAGIGIVRAQSGEFFITLLLANR